MKLNSENQKKILNIEKELFNIENFNREKTVFPNKVFNKRFDKYYFLDTDDWFGSEDEFKKLTEFVDENGEKKFYNTAPSFYDVSGIEIPIDLDYNSYVSEQTFTDDKGNIHNGIGLRIAPEMFYFDLSKKWAIVFDLTNNIFIVGLENDLVESFEKKFNGQFKSIKEHLDFLESSKGSSLENKQEILLNYS